MKMIYSIVLTVTLYLAATTFETSAKSIKKYNEFRKILLSKGWKPFDFGKNSIEFSEVVCGLGYDALCSATWVDAEGKYKDVNVMWDKRKHSKTKGELVTNQEMTYITEEIYTPHLYPPEGK